jgi:dipeptidyl aminopeptidase/acylaminoacyl peptidase
VEPRPTHTATPQPSATIAATETAEPLPTKEGNQLPEEEYQFLFATELGLWTVGADGLGLTQVSDVPPVPSDDHTVLVAPGGEHVAFITSSMEDRYRGLRLMLLSFPEGTVEEITPLTSPETEPDADALQGDDRLEIVRAFVDVDSMAWSPDGRRLAFTSAHAGPSSDVYVYSLEDESITKLTDGPSQAMKPSWSPDGNTIVHAGVNTFGTGAGYSMAGVWAVQADGSTAPLSLYDPSNSGDEEWVGWASDDTIIVYSWSPACGPMNLRAVNVETGEASVLLPDAFEALAFDTESTSIALAVRADAFIPECNPNGLGGLYLVQPSPEAPQQITEAATSHVAWSPEAGLFFARSEDGTRAIQPTGEARLLDGPTGTMPIAAPDGETVVWTTVMYPDVSGLWVGSIEGGEATEVFTGPAGAVTWSPNGQSLFFTSEAETLYVAQSPDYTPGEVAGGTRITGLGWVRR